MMVDIIPIPPFPEIWDSSIRSTWTACPRQFVEEGCYPNLPVFVPSIYNLNLDYAKTLLPMQLKNYIEFQQGFDGYWIWLRGRSVQRYGQVRWNGRATLVHRLVYQITVSKLSKGYHLDHLCQEPLCCNPNHLEEVTFQENLSRGRISIVGLRRLQTHCASNHLLDSTDNRGRRFCSICARTKWRNASRRQRTK